MFLILKYPHSITHYFYSFPLNSISHFWVTESISYINLAQPIIVISTLNNFHYRTIIPIISYLNPSNSKSTTLTIRLINYHPISLIPCIQSNTINSIIFDFDPLKFITHFLNTNNHFINAHKPDSYFVYSFDSQLYCFTIFYFHHLFNLIFASSYDYHLIIHHYHSKFTNFTLLNSPSQFYQYLLYIY